MWRVISKMDDHPFWEPDASWVMPRRQYRGRTQYRHVRCSIGSVIGAATRSDI